jgi:Skp family chaperone for outer membrane proteins
LEPNRNSMQKPTEGGAHKASKHTLQKRISNLTEKFDGDTQRIRAQLILELKSLQETAVEQVQSTTGRKTREQQNWARLAAYISQVINSISKTYDITQIKNELEQLRKMIGELEKQ